MVIVGGGVCPPFFRGGEGNGKAFICKDVWGGGADGGGVVPDESGGDIGSGGDRVGMGRERAGGEVS